MMFTAILWALLAAFLIRRLLAPPGAGALPANWSSMEAEVGRLREEVDRLTSEVGRLEEEQRFLLKLVGERDTPRLPGGGEPG